MEDEHLWGDDDGDHASSASTVSWEKKLAEQHIERMRSTFAEAGYREAMMKAKDSAAETVVSGAFKQGLLQSFKWGVERGRVSAMLSVIDRSQNTTQSMISDVDPNQLKSELQTVLERITKECGTPTEPTTTTATTDTTTITTATTDTSTATTSATVTPATNCAATTTDTTDNTISNGVACDADGVCVGDGESNCSKQCATNTTNATNANTTTPITDKCCSKAYCCQSQSQSHANNNDNNDNTTPTSQPNTTPQTPQTTQTTQTPQTVQTVQTVRGVVSRDNINSLVETQTEVDRLWGAMFPQH